MKNPRVSQAIRQVDLLLSQAQAWLGKVDDVSTSLRMQQAAMALRRRYRDLQHRLRRVQSDCGVSNLRAEARLPLDESVKHATRQIPDDVPKSVESLFVTARRFSRAIAKALRRLVVSPRRGNGRSEFDRLIGEFDRFPDDNAMPPGFRKLHPLTPNPGNDRDLD